MTPSPPPRSPGPSGPSGAPGAPAVIRSTRSPSSYPLAGLAMRFQVRLEESGTDLGKWSACRGLQVQFASKEIAEGGEYCERALLPEQLSYSTVTLERMMTQADSPRLQAWLAQVAARWTGYEYDGGSGAYEGQHMTIQLWDHQGKLVTEWVLRNAVPKQWVGPDLDARGASVAIEKLSFEHQGFLRYDAGAGPGVVR
ncbi:phage tail protein [Streptomyces sp. NPDC015131]|uniref:phage tail protein n=1 Tax=Streptomyces sp. NPDC015131 TaxID=3364941 RepID=UPI003700D0CC